MALIKVNGTSLASAIASAQAGDVLDLAAGSYAGRVAITKPLTIQGDGGAIIEGGAGDGFINISVQNPNVILRGLDIRHAGAGIRFTGNCAGSFVEWCTFPIIDWMVRNTPTPTNDDNGGNGIQFTRTSGVIVRDCEFRLCRAKSSDYKVDGGAFDLYASSDITIERCEVWDSVNMLETGKGANDNPNANLIIRDNIFHGRLYTGRPAGPTTVVNGILLRSAYNSVISGNLFDEIDWWAIHLAAGNFSGPFSNVQIVGNHFRLPLGVNRAFAVDAGIVTSMFKVDGNAIWVSDGTTIAKVGTAELMNLAALQSATGWMVGTVGPEPDPDLTISHLEDEIKHLRGIIDLVKAAVA